MTSVSRSRYWTACLGNFFEHYDAALFGFLSPFLAPLMFPEQEPMTALIYTYAIIPLGMLARPVGSLVFGFIGDIYGRKQALFLTLAGMAFVSGCIALTPTYQQVGILAPFLFFLGRVLQNFLAAGETMGGAIFLLEQAPEKQHDFLSGLYNASNIGGHLFASFGVFLLSQSHWIDPGWRVLYLCGCITALFGCMIRRSSSFEPQSLQRSKNLKEILWTCRRPFFFIVITSGFGFACYSMALVLVNGLIPLVSTFSITDIMRINTYLLVLDFCALPFFGWVASRISRELLMISASLGVIICSIPLFLLVEGGSLASILFVRIALVLLGVAFFAPFHAWAGQLIPPAYRYVVISLGYALGSQLLGGPTAALALWCFKTTGMISSVAWYWMFLGFASSVVLLITWRAKNKIQIVE